MKSVKITVSGRVQGVGFRYMTKMVADKLDIVGLVRNKSDGSVYIEACGEEAKLAEFIRLVKASPSPSGKVTDCQVVESETLPQYQKFLVTA